MLTIPLQLSWCCLYIMIPTPLCCAHIIVLPNRCSFYYAHSSNVRLVFPVYILYLLQCLVYFGIIFATESSVAFSTIIAWSYRAWQRAICVSYYNIIYILFLPLSLSKNTECPQTRAQNWPKIVATLRCFYHISRVLQPKNYTAQKIHRFLRCICVIPTSLTFAYKRDESGSHELSGHYFLRSRYSPLAVSTEITSPVLMKAGTLTTKPVSSVASLSTLLVVSPFTTSSV